jgi:hypothetical protein
MVLDCGLLPILRELLSHERMSIRKEACWTISNITAGIPSQVQSSFQIQPFKSSLALQYLNLASKISHPAGASTAGQWCHPCSGSDGGEGRGRHPQGNRVGYFQRYLWRRLFSNQAARRERLHSTARQSPERFAPPRRASGAGGFAEHPQVRVKVRVESGSRGGGYHQPLCCCGQDVCVCGEDSRTCASQ